MKKLLIASSLFVFALGLAPGAEAGVDAAATFDQLKSLEGTWTGTPHGSGAAEKEADESITVVHEFEVSANGTVVMETMNPDTEHEMINMYTVDGDDVLLTHYCAGGNQPRMRLDREASATDSLVFDFDGGTNLDPAVDPHIHSANLRMLEDGRLHSIWHSQMNGEPAGEMQFHLSRAAD